MRLECFGKNVPTRSSLFSMNWWLCEMTCSMSDPSQRHIFICWIREEPRAKLGFPPVSLKLVQNHKDTEPESILQVHWRFLEFLSCFRIVSSALWCVYSASRCNFSFCIQRARHRWVINSSSQFSSFQLLSCVWLFATAWTATHQASLSITNSQSLLKLMSIESVMPSNHLILCHPLSSCLQSFPASQSFQMSQVFTSGGQRIGVQLQHQSFQWIFRTDFL